MRSDIEEQVTNELKSPVTLMAGDFISNAVCFCLYFIFLFQTNCVNLHSIKCSIYHE